MSASDRSRLFHAIVVVGLSFGAGACGGSTSTPASDGGARDADGPADGWAANVDAARPNDAGFATSDSQAPDSGDAALVQPCETSWPCYI
jgi:hypothetical protein